MRKTETDVVVSRTLRAKRFKKLTEFLLRKGYTVRLAPKVEAARFDRRA